MNRISRTDFQKVLAQLVNLEEKEEEIVQELYEEPSPQRTHFQKLLANYIAELDNFLKKATVVEEEVPLPLVLLESRTLASDLESKEEFEFQLVLPFQAGDLDHVSILSPLGQALLFKRPGENVQLSAPGGDFHYQIISISYP